MKKRIETLQKECEQCSKTLDRHLGLYAEKLLPKQKELVDSLKLQVKFFYPYLQDKKALRKDERVVLKGVISFVFKKICDMEGPNMEMDEELSSIHEEIVGASYLDKQSSDFEEFKKGVESQFAEKGMPIDLSDVKFEGSQEETMRNLFESIASAQEKLQEKPFEKTQKQLEKEQRALEVETVQKKEIGTLYKQLAKMFHPDLETDPVAKREKEVLMKKLTSAYEEGDMHTLLALEMSTLDDSEKKTRTADQLKVYNKLLQEQVVILEQKLQAIPLDYRYISLLNYTYYHWRKGDSCIFEIYKTMNDEVGGYKKMMQQAQKRPTEVIRSLIEGFQVTALFEDFF